MSNKKASAPQNKKKKPEHTNKKLLPLPAKIQAQFLEFSRMVKKEYGPLLTVGVDMLTGKAKRRREKDIPYSWPEFMKTTENPVFRLKLQSTGITLTNATNYNSLYNLQAQFLQNFDDVANMWDEYRFLRGEFQIFPAVSVVASGGGGIATGFGGACVDYGVSSVLGSFNAGIGHDTWKFCHFLAAAGVEEKNGGGGIKWPVKFEKLTDETWIPTTTNNSTVCFWKPYIPGTSIPYTQTNAFYVQGWFDLQVRGQAG